MFDLDSTVEQAVHAAIKESDAGAELSGKTGELSVVLCNDEFIRTLNRDYRGKDKPTNVLSFPQFDFAGDERLSDPVPLGDLVLAYETIAREAQEQNKSFQSHFTHLVVHGTLHLLGYDHEETDEADEMEAIEIIALKKLGIENPYSDIDFMA